MRALLLLLVVVPTAVAQGSSFTLDGMPGAPIRPLVDEIVVNWTADLACPPPEANATLTEFRVWASERPTWASVSFEPASASFDGCVEGRLAVRGLMKVRVDAEVAALESGTIQVQTSYPDAHGLEAGGTNVVQVRAGYYGIVDVQAAETIAIARPGGNHTFVLRVANLGNGPTRFAIEVVDTARGLTVDVPPPFVLESRQSGATGTSRDVPVLVHAARAAGYANEVGVVNLRITSESAVDGAPGDPSHVSLLLTTRGFATPGPSLAIVLALAAALALALRRR